MSPHCIFNNNPYSDKRKLLNLKGASMQKIELISFKLCPFVQRSVITLLKKGVAFKITYIDLADKPDWFLALSPLGKVPVLKYEDEVLFESAVINEFLDEITPPLIMPPSPILKAKDRAWIEFSSQVIMDQYRLCVAKSEAEFGAQRTAFAAKLEQLEQVLQGNYFSGDTFSLVDAAIAPVMIRMEIFKKYYQLDFLSKTPKLAALSKKLITEDYVKESVVDDFEELFQAYFKEQQGYIFNRVELA